MGSRWVRAWPRLAVIAIALPLLGLLAGQLSGAPADHPHEAHHRETIAASRVVDLGGGLQMVVVALLSPDAAADVEAILDDLAPSQGIGGEDGTVTAQFALLRKWSKPFLPLPIWYNPEDEPPGLDFASLVEEAADTWSAVEGQYFRFDYRGLTDRRLDGGVGACSLDNPDVHDGQNTLSWSRHLPGGVLAVTCVLRQADEPFDGSPGRMCRVLDGVCAVIEADIRFNTQVAWSVAAATPADMFDLPSNLLHELGHMVGLDHSSVGDPVMHPQLPPGKQRRVLQPDDIEGMLALYAGELFEHTIVVPGTAVD